MLFSGVAYAGTLGTAVTAGESTSGIGQTYNWNYSYNGQTINRTVTEYFIPLSAAESGTFGVNGKGLTSDSGSGYGYEDDTKTALFMNLYFNLSTEPLAPIATDANIEFFFDDLDLIPGNDPDGFHESITFKYWDSGDVNVAGDGEFKLPPSLIPNNPPYDPSAENASQLTSAPFTGSTYGEDAGDRDPRIWNLDLAALGLIGELNDSAAELNGFWIQLGFDSKYVYTRDYYYPDGTLKYAAGDPRTGHNTAEYISATLHVSAVPLPSSVWLFGTALLGFIGFSRRTRI